jgi:hypothetical protein
MSAQKPITSQLFLGFTQSFPDSGQQSILNNVETGSFHVLSNSLFVQSFEDFNLTTDGAAKQT